jgi:hypothetical protein
MDTIRTEVEESPRQEFKETGQAKHVHVAALEAESHVPREKLQPLPMSLFQILKGAGGGATALLHRSVLVGQGAVLAPDTRMQPRDSSTR